MGGAINAYSKVMNFIYTLIGIIVVVAIAFFGYQYLFGNETIQSNSNYFEITVSQKYMFENNTEATDAALEIAIWSATDGLYVFGYTYLKEDNAEEGTLKSHVEEEIKAIAETEGNRDVTELKEEIIDGKTAYTYTFCYTDNEVSESFMSKIVWIEAEEEYYALIIECPEAEKDTYTEVLDKIGQSFKVIK